MTSVLVVPLLLAAGYMIDVTTITRTRTELQQAIDAAVLAVAREGKSISEGEARDIAERFVDDNFDPAYTRLSVVKDGTEFTVKAQTRVKMAFGGLLGYSDWPVAASSSADIAYASYEIALVLDTTGSMAGGKLASMKDAVLGLIDSMSAQVDNEDKLKFAMVPFATFVNVGPQYGPSFDKDGRQIGGTGADWLDLAGEADMPQAELGPGASRFQLYHNLDQAWPGCVETRYAPGKDHDVDDTEPDPARAETLFVPAFGIDEPDGGRFANSYIKSGAKPNDKSVKEKKDRWAKYGVDTDAAGNPLLGGLLDSTVTTVVDSLLGGHKVVPIDTGLSKTTGKRKGPGHGCEVQPISPLTADYDGLKAKVNALKANGTTNIMEGVAWGARVLSPGAPFGEGQDEKAGVEKIMIVLTDGSNVFGNTSNDLGSSYSSLGYLVDGRLGIAAGGSSATNGLMNARTLAACTSAKDAGLEVYTLRLEEPNVATGTMLKECASAEDHYFDVPSRSQLDEAFAKIRERIVRVRIAS